MDKLFKRISYKMNKEQLLPGGPRLEPNPGGGGGLDGALGPGGRGLGRGCGPCPGRNGGGVCAAVCFWLA